MRLLNLGCGSRFNKEWVNVDFNSNPPNVIGHNLLEGIPFPVGEFDMVYHSHTLEHFSKDDGFLFIQECYRTLKPGGIIRVAVPDLERIVRCYLEQLQNAMDGDKTAAFNYDWMMLELYDQTVREKPGGNMLKYLQQESLPNENFVIDRVGMEAINIRSNMKRTKPLYTKPSQPKISLKKILSPSAYKNSIKRLLIKENQKPVDKHTSIGQFRKGGEIHQWMYDRYSLSKLLTAAGFKNVIIRNAFDSYLANWNAYELESKNGMIFKPDSLFIEAIK